MRTNPDGSRRNEPNELDQFIEIADISAKRIRQCVNLAVTVALIVLVALLLRLIPDEPASSYQAVGTAEVTGDTRQ